MEANPNDDILLELHSACVLGNDDKVEEILQMDNIRVFIDSPAEKDGTTPLHMAVDGGYFKIVQMLVDKGADLTTHDNNGLNIMHRALRNCSDKSLLRYLIDKEICFELIDKSAEEDHFSPLMCGLINENAEAVKFLLELEGKDIQYAEGKIETYHLDFTKITKDGQNIMHLAAAVNDRDLLELMLGKIKEKKVELDFTQFEASPVTLASKTRCWDNVDILVNLGGFESDKNGMYLALEEVIKEGNIDILKRFLQYKSFTFINESSKEKESYGTPLVHVAVNCDRRKEMLEQLVKQGVDITLPNEKGQTILHVIAANGFEETLMTLVDNLPRKNFNTNFQSILHQSCIEYPITIKGKGAVDLKMCTPLRLAAVSLHSKLVKTLLQFGAIPFDRDREGRTALDLVQQFLSDMTPSDKNKADIVIELLQDAMDRKEVWNHAEKLFAMIGKMEENIIANFDNALHNDVMKHCFEKLTQEFQSGLIRVEQPNDRRYEHGRTELHLSVIKNDLQSTKKFLKQECDPDIVDDKGKRAIDYAVEKGYIDIVQLLLRFDANTCGLSHVAAYFGQSDIMKQLKDVCNDVSAEYKLGENFLIRIIDGKSFSFECTSLDVACLQGYTETAEYLIQDCCAVPNLSLFDHHCTVESVKHEYQETRTEIHKLLKNITREGQQQVGSTIKSDFNEIEGKLDNLLKSVDDKMQGLTAEINSLQATSDETKGILTTVKSTIETSTNEMKAMLEKESEETREIIKTVKYDVLGIMPSVSVDEISQQKVFTKVSQEMGRQERKGEKYFWEIIMRDLLQNCPAKAINEIVESISRNNNSEVDCAAEGLMFWKSIACYGHFDDNKMNQLADVLKEHGLCLDLQTIRSRQSDLWKNAKSIPLEKEFLKLAGKIGKEWEQLGIHLGFESAEIDHIKLDKKDHSTVDKIVAMLVKWYQKESGFMTCKIVRLSEALKDTNRMDLSEIVDQIVKSKTCNLF